MTPRWWTRKRAKSSGCPSPTPWVAANVIPHLDIEPITLQEAQYRLRVFLNGIDRPTVIADWPEDIAHLWKLLLVAPGQMMAVPDLTTTMLHLPGFNASVASKKPHNSLADATALRDFYVENKYRD